MISLFFKVKTSTIFHLLLLCVGGDARQVYPCAYISPKCGLGDNALCFNGRGGDNDKGGIFQKGVYYCIFVLLLHLYF